MITSNVYMPKGFELGSFNVLEDIKATPNIDGVATRHAEIEAKNNHTLKIPVIESDLGSGGVIKFCW